MAALHAAILIAAAPVKAGSDYYGEVTLANSAHLNEIEAEGDIKLQDTTLNSKVIITGSLQAQDSQFHQSLTFTGQKALFSGCSLSSITIRRDASFKAKQVIELKKTVVDGSIVFEGGNGEIILYPGSKIRGSVSGGKIAYKN